VRTLSLLALALVLGGFAALDTRAAAQEPPKGPAPKPQAIFAQVRDLVAEGKFDIAANFLQAFLDSNPTDADLIEIEKRFGTTAFTGLRTVRRWSDDPATEKKARANVEEAIKKAKAASEKLLRDPARVQKYIRNLGATFEERVYAQMELKRTGDFAIPFMVEELRITREPEIRDGIIQTITKLEGPTMAGWIAALDGLTPDLQYFVLKAIAARGDILTLQTNAQTDIAPVLWRIMALPADASPTLRAFAESTLNTLRPGVKAGGQIPEAQLVALARTFYDHKARFQGEKNNPGSTSTVPLWVWDPADPQAPKLKLVEEVPVGQAEEYYGLRYAKWALERRPDYEPAQGLILALAAERAIERAKFGDLAKLEPAVFKLLSDAPGPVLDDLLTRGLSKKKTGLVLAMIQVLGERAEKASLSELVKALDYPDPAVQIAAANALLRSPTAVPPAAKGKIVDILRRAAATEGPVPEAKGTALIADPNRHRADDAANLFRGLDYRVEVFTNGRDLLRRVARSSDFDVLFIDHHTPNPELIDLIGQLQSNPKAGGRPTFVVASTDTPRVPTFDQLVVRFAALIAATENEAVPMPAPFVPHPRMSSEEIANERRRNQELRDAQFRRTADQRIARLKRVIEATGLTLTETQRLLMDLRIELVAYAVLATEFPLSPQSAPATVEHLTKLRRQISLQPPSPPYGAGTPTTDMLRLMERFETDLARVPQALKRFEDIYSHVDPVELGLPVETFRDEALEARLAKKFGNYPKVRIVPEPFGRGGLASDLRAAQAAPAQAPRDPADVKAAQKLAVEWLRKMATGEVTGYDIRGAEPELRAALRVEDLADDAIAAVSRYGSSDAQQALLSLALNMVKPLPLRTKAADAVIRHVQLNGKAIDKSLMGPLLEEAEKEPDPTLRGKFETLRALLARDPARFLGEVTGYNPPLLPPPPMVPEPKKQPEEKKEPEEKKP
jgi:CheY-like chemotaxis protein